MLLLLCLMMMIGRASGALAQLTVTFVVDPQEAQAALGAERIAPMNAALDSPTVNLQIVGPVAPTPEQPEAGAHLRTGRPTFVWIDSTTNSEFYSINIFRGLDPNLLPPNTDPLVFDHIPGSPYTVPLGQDLPPGTYSWELVGRLVSLGFYSAGYRTFTVHCRADFDLDGVITPADVSLFTGTWFADIQNGTLEADFDGSGVVEPADMSLFVATWFDQVANGC